MPIPHAPTTAIQVEAAGQRYRQTDAFVYLGGTVTEAPGVTTEIQRRIRACWMRVKKYSTQLYDRPTAAIALKTRMAKAEAIEALLYGSTTWTPAKETTANSGRRTTASSCESSAKRVPCRPTTAYARTRVRSNERTARVSR